MVTQISEVEAYVTNAIQASARLADESVTTAITNLKKELTDAFTNRVSEQDALIKSSVEKVASEVKNALEKSEKENGENNHALEQRLEIANQAMLAALAKLGALEGAILPSLEPRLHKFESDLAALEAKGRDWITKAKEASAAASTTSPTPAAPMTSSTTVEASSEPTASAGAAAERGASSGTEAGRPVGSVYGTGPSHVQWPDPSEAAREAARAADPELKKNVWERKGFDKRLSKYTNEKGAQELKDWSYELRRVTSKDLHFHEFLRWLEEDKLESSKGEINLEVMKELKRVKKWDVVWLNEQLYGILAEGTQIASRAKGTVMSLESESDVNGAKAYRAFARKHLDGSQRSTVALGTRITKPSMAPMDEFEDRLRLYDQDRERYERLSGQVVGELAFVHLQDMIPQEVRGKFDNEKHNFTKLEHLRAFFTRVIDDYKASGAPKRKLKGLNELSNGEVADQAQEADEPEEGNTLYQLLCHASDEDVAKILGPSELQSFVRWKQAGGKGYTRYQASGSGGKKGSSWNGAGGKGAGASPGAGQGKGAGADDACGYCGKPGHFKRDCAELDKVMAARRASGLSPPRGVKGKGKGSGFSGAGVGASAGGGKGAFGLDFPQIDQPQAMPSGQFQGGPFSGGPFAPPQGPLGQPAAAVWGQSVPMMANWGGGLRCLTRVDPSVEVAKDAEEAMPSQESVESQGPVEPFVHANSFSALVEDDGESDKKSAVVEVCEPPSLMANFSACRNRRSRNRVSLSAVFLSAASECGHAACLCGDGDEGSVPESPNPVIPDEPAVVERIPLEVEESSAKMQPDQTEEKSEQVNVMVPKKLKKKRKKEGRKRNAGVRKQERASPPVETCSSSQFDFGALAEKVAERKALERAIPNFAMFYGLKVSEVSWQMLKDSSAGVYGWAYANIEGQSTAYSIAMGSGVDLPPTAEDGRQGEKERIKKHSGAPETKPKDEISAAEASRLVAAHEEVIEARRKELELCRQQWAQGKMPIGICRAKDFEELRRQEWKEVRNERQEAFREKRLARALNCFLLREAAGASGGPMCGAWQMEDRGWSRVKVIMDSGAAESVCPRSMAPQFMIQDSVASRAGVYYTSANGGKIMNLGEQHVPVCLANGARTIATFQVADVSRPLMSVGKLCEMGNRVIFGANGGVILNLQTGEATPFAKDEGVYTFEMWIPPLSESPFGRPR